MSRISTMSVSLAVAVLVMPVLAACSGSDTKSANGYCDQVKLSAQTIVGLDNLDSQNLGALTGGLKEASAEFDKIISVAPAGIKTEWESTGKAISGAATLLEPFKNLDLSDPSKIEPAELTKFTEAAKGLQNLGPTIDANSKKIDEFTKKECGFTLDEATGNTTTTAP